MTTLDRDGPTTRRNWLEDSAAPVSQNHGRIANRTEALDWPIQDTFDLTVVRLIDHTSGQLSAEERETPCFALRSLSVPIVDSAAK